MGEIHILDKSVSNMIAAGEVVERPQSIVKELIENSIDAGATTITVTISDGGASLIRVTDNGSGMSEEDAKICFLRHATSKIRTQTDLDAIYTLGFRGEALSSIGAVSRVKIYTKRADAKDGVCVTCEGGVIVSSVDAGTPNGTIVEVKDLFFNTPARKKFLKKPATEGGYISDIIERYTLSHPEISFKFVRDGKEVIFSPGDNKLRNAVYAVYGKDYATKPIDVDFTMEDIHITGVIGPGTMCRPNRNYESFFVNRRYIKSALMYRATEEAYKNQIMIGKFPMAVLNIEIPADRVDINVHPTKLECKFSQEELIYRAVYQAVRNALYELPNVPVIERKKEEIRASRENFLREGGEQSSISFAPSQEKRSEPKAVVEPVKPVVTEAKPLVVETIHEVRPPRRTGVDGSFGDKYPKNIAPKVEKVLDILEKIKPQPEEKPKATGVEKREPVGGFRIIPIEPQYKLAEDMTPEERKEWEKKRRKYFTESGEMNSQFNKLYLELYRVKRREMADARRYNRAISLIGYNPDQPEMSDDFKCFVHCANLMVERAGYIMRPGVATDFAQLRMKSIDINRELEFRSDDPLYPMPEDTPEETEVQKDNMFLGDFRVIGQLFSTYILVEKDDMMLMIDQHAAHERLNFEKLKEEMQDRGVMSQMVMMPIEFKLTGEEAELARDNGEILTKMGFEFVIDGNNGISVTSIPSGISWSDCEDLLVELIGELSDNRLDIINKKTERMLYSISCKASIKANMQITIPEMEALCKRVFALENINTCPHGRPIVISMSKKEIEKNFKRIV